MQRMRGYDGRGRGTSNIMKKYLVIMVLFVALTLASCSDANTGRSIIASMDDLQEYTEIYGEYLKDYTIRSPNDTIYAEVEHGNAVLCYDIQAVVALEKEIANKRQIIIQLQEEVEKNEHRLNGLTSILENGDLEQIAANVNLRMKDK